MSQFDYVNNYYGMSVKRGMPVNVKGKPARVTGADGQYIKIKIDGHKYSFNYHPKDDDLEWPTQEKA
jgi:hypothetical protein